MCTWPRRCPTRPLPALHAFELRSVIDLDDTIDLTVWVGVVLSSEDLLAVNKDGCDAAESCFGGGDGDLATAILAAI
jgi:hypothetical protein